MVPSFDLIGKQSTININIPDIKTQFSFAFLLEGMGKETVTVTDLTFHHLLTSVRPDNEKSQLINFCVNNFDDIQLDRVKSTSSHLCGILVGKCNRGKMNLSKVSNSRDRGIQLSGVQNFIVDQADVDGCGIGNAKNDTVGNGFTGSRLPGWFDNFNLTIQNSNVTRCSRKCIDIHNGRGVIIKENKVSEYEWAGIHAVNQSSNKRVENVKIFDNDVSAIKTSGWGGGIVVGNSDKRHPMGYVKIRDNDLRNAHNVQQIVMHHDGDVEHLEIQNNAIQKDTGYFRSKGVFVVAADKAIKRAKITGNTILMRGQGACIVLNDIETAHVQNNDTSTRGTKGDSYCLDVKNIKRLTESGNTLDARLPGKQKRIVNAEPLE